AACLNCPECERGAFVHCRTWRQSHIDPGGMAEWVRVPEENVRTDTFAVNDLQPEQAVFIEPLGCSVKALHRLRPGTGPTGCSIGCGVMGLLNLMAARALGARQLVAVEPDAVRRDFALSCGADCVLTPDEASREVREAVDFVVIGPGHPHVIRQALT